MKKTSQDGELNFIGHTTSIEGNINSDGDLHVNGSVKGIIRCKGSISLGENGLIEGDVHSDNAIIGGTIKGRLLVKNKITLESKSNLLGEMSCARLIIEEGAVFAGNSAMGEKTSHTLKNETSNNK